MIPCNRCKKNVAVVFITKIENKKTINEGLCIPCAKDMGMGNIEDLVSGMGIGPEELENLEDQVTSLVMKQEDNPAGEPNDDDSPFKSFFKMMGGEGREKTVTREKKPKAKKRLIDSYGTNLTKKAQRGEVDAVIGREEEIMRCIEILNRRTKNNPCLIGEPGVGKTAIAEGLAMRITQGRVPAKLLNSEIYLLDFTSIVAGTQFRGQFESRLKGILEEVKKLGNIILVIDELHNIVGAGEAEGAMSAANILKPALARGEVRVIGATTLTEYRKYIEKDSALERRFQPVIVEEPSIEESIEIIKGIKGYYEEFHRVLIPEQIVRSAVILGERYIHDRFLPDKAIDIIDEAASRANLKNEKIAELARLQDELTKVQSMKETAVNEDSIEYYQKAADLKMQECRLLESIEKTESELEDIYLTVDDIASVVERWTKIPASSIKKEESHKLLKLEDILKRRVRGQDEAISAVAGAVRRGRAGLSKKRRPVSFIFTGQTGVGKTELALSLAEAIFDSEEALIRLDMSEYMEKHSVSKIIGAPPGYIGYDDAGQLTEKIRRRPYAVILLDEIEKAHGDVLNILLQILDDGRITDSQGKTVNFENTIIIMTSNAGSDHKGVAPGYTSNPVAASADKIKEALKEIFRPEFLNRVDEIVTFNALGRDILMEILKKLMDEFSEMLKENDVNFKISDEALEIMLEMGYEPKNGARPLRRIIQKALEDKAAYMLISGELSAGSVLSVVAENGEIILKGEE